MLAALRQGLTEPLPQPSTESEASGGALRFSHQPDASRYALHAGDDLVSVLDYRDDGTSLALTRAYTVPTFRGHGYAGVIKRFGQGRTPTSHGGGPVHRHAGSMGSSTDPSRIFPGKKQAGHMGVDQVTVQNLDVVKVDPELNMIVVRGAIPGPKGGIVYIKSTVKKTVVKKGDAGISTNPQKASGRNPQKASARK